MNRDFVYGGNKFHLNDNGLPNSPRREFEGKYMLLMYTGDYWQELTTCNTKKEALEYIKHDKE
jgi:hypothetical protein